MKKFLRIGIISIAMAALPLLGGSVSALSWADLFGGTPSTSMQNAPAMLGAEDTHPCLRFTNHEYEVCTAYVANSSLAVLVPYYKYANAGDSWSRYVTYRLGSRYTNQAYDQIRSRVAGWPAGKNDVDVPQIEILSVNSNLATNTAVLMTSETWRVRSPDGTIVYQEVWQRHTVTMKRVPSYVLHKWVVTDFQ